MCVGCGGDCECAGGCVGGDGCVSVGQCCVCVTCGEYVLVEWPAVLGGDQPVLECLSQPCDECVWRRPCLWCVCCVPVCGGVDR